MILFLNELLWYTVVTSLDWGLSYRWTSRVRPPIFQHPSDINKDSATFCNFSNGECFCCSVKLLRFICQIIFQIFTIFWWSSVLVNSLSLWIPCFCIKSLLAFVWWFISICFNLHDNSFSVDFNCLTGKITIIQTKCSFPMSSVFFRLVSALKILVIGIWK